MSARRRNEMGKLEGGLNPLKDVALGSSAAGTADPYKWRLEVRAPRRKRGAKGRRRPGIFYAVRGGEWRSTRIPETQPERAQAYLDGVRNAELNELLGRVMPGAMTFATVLCDHVANVAAKARTNNQRRMLGVLEHKAAVLARTFGLKRLADYVAQDSIDFHTAYVAERNAYYDANPLVRRRNSAVTATDLLRLLRSAVAHYPARHGQFWRLDIHVPPLGTTTSPRWFTRHEVARLLFACRGWKWDQDQGCWHRLPGRAARKRRRHLTRLIRLGIKTATRHDAMLSMAWGKHSNSACVVIDAEGRGWVHRRGSDEIETKKARPSLETFEEIEFLLRGWAKEDGHIGADGSIRGEPRHRYLIHPPSGGYFLGYLNAQFADLCRDAGVAHATVHALKHTAVTWANQRGITLAAAEQTLGTTAGTLLKYYTHWGVAARRSARDEFDDRASRRLLRKVHRFEPKVGERVRRSDRPVKPRK